MHSQSAKDNLQAEQEAISAKLGFMMFIRMVLIIAKPSNQSVKEANKKASKQSINHSASLFLQPHSKALSFPHPKEILKVCGTKLSEGEKQDEGCGVGDGGCAFLRCYVPF